MASYNPNKRELENLRKAFGEVKAENDQLLTEPHSNTFVHTRVYREVRNAQRCLLIGNKGSGKTALLLGYQHEHTDRYLEQATIDIQADDFPLEALFSFFYTDVRRALGRVSPKVLPPVSDLPAFVDPVRLASYAWTQSLMCGAIFKTSAALLATRSHALTEAERKTLRSAQRAIGGFVGMRQISFEGESGSEIVFSLLVYFFQSVQEVINKAIGVHTEDISTLLATVTRLLARKLKSQLEQSIDDAARIIRRVLEREGCRTLVTLDRFDDFYDQFYRQSRRNEAVERREFLSALLHGLVIATRDLKRDLRFDWLHMLFAIPMDKFLELHLRERVTFEHAHTLRLEWTPLELFEYVNRRIAYALDLPADAARNPWDMLFPFEVTNGTVREVKEPSFLYVVRHSLWRPREVQMYLNAIFRLMDESRQPADEEMFRFAVKSESEKIIRQEFIEEFQSEFPRMPGVFRKLENFSLATVMPYEELYDRLTGVSLLDDEDTPGEVMLRLYHMGVLGVRQVLQARRSAHADATITQQREEVVYRYCYNSEVEDPFNPGVTVAFHPMFFEYLNIKHQERYVVNQLSWEMFNGSYHGR